MSGNNKYPFISIQDKEKVEEFLYSRRRVNEQKEKAYLDKLDNKIEKSRNLIKKQVAYMTKQ